MIVLKTQAGNATVYGMTAEACAVQMRTLLRRDVRRVDAATSWRRGKPKGLHVWVAMDNDGDVTWGTTGRESRAHART